MLKYHRKKNIKQFHIAKLQQKSANADLKLNYRKNIELSLIISIICIIILFQVIPQLNKNKIIYSTDVRITMLDIIQIPEIKEIPPPPLVKKVELIPKAIIKSKAENEQTLKEEAKNTDLKLDIFENQNISSMFTNSQFSDLASINYTNNKYSTENISGLEFDYKSNRNIYDTNNNLSLDISKNIENRKNKRSESIELDINSQPKSIDSEIAQKEERFTSIDKILNINENQFILREEESTIGTREYKTWNRINSALDRINKDRYGKFPNNVIRNSDGLVITFNYNSSYRQDIFWTKGGKVIIRITGNRPQEYIQELTKAYNSLMQLIYEKNI